ncbi:hypothetical protein SanaruYs_00480 [Chryseotalea sanaruensis]|uniref:Uncharacterized protein n=1 Tax=Chryseotalea sanaruensis TaxID=2482724 RepID=A0A401U4F7_9BACT|nr:hypothetical protein [Chryseotalea sanaruensis]GCC49834.1 hypothetical protein SanaruYs_00480 [Chryseotalea sanaruensis]
MKKTIYNSAPIQRSEIDRNQLAKYIDSTAMPKLILEVFIRKNFGERYFTFWSAIKATLVLAVLPLFILYFPRIFFIPKFRLQPIQWPDFFWSYATWYVFTIAFLIVAYKRHEETRRRSNEYDFETDSLYAGDIHPRFLKNKTFGEPNIKTIETLSEPAFFFVIGIALIIFGQSLGMLLVLCSILYSWNSRLQYKIGHHRTLDTIEERLFNNQKFETYVDKVKATPDGAVRERVDDTGIAKNDDVFEAS